jgi:methyl-accepting chemotaxis protein-1 (serine sensor receptor)
MTVARRLALGVSLLLLMTLAVAGLGAWGMWQSQAALQTVYEDRTVPLEQLADINYRVTRNRVLLSEATVMANAEVSKKHLAEFEANVKAIQKDLDAYNATSMTPEESALAKTVNQARRALLQDGFQPVAAAVTAGDYAQAQVALQRVATLNAPFDESMNKLIELQVHVAAEEYKAAQERSHKLNLANAGLVVLAVLAGVGVGVTMTRSLTRALGAEPAELAAAAGSIAQGNLADDGRPAGPAGSVMASMQAMRAALVAVVGEVRSGVESVATASSQIAQGNLDLSSRTEQQAASLQQTAASMEQLTSTVRASADSAREANQMAQGASSAALRGGAVVAQVVQTMGDIHTASNRIAEITGVIDGIAFQTNILALNAAVEAARAGEQGRGFAVVATEVRTLAQRSADAARQIKSLIGDSAAKVETGGTLVQEAGVTMAEVVRQVQRVTDLIGEITAAAGEQSQGIAQVGQAVTQLDQTTQQNAALVEESAAAAESLKAQAARLAEAVSVFRLERSAS